VPGGSRRGGGAGWRQGRSARRGGGAVGWRRGGGGGPGRQECAAGRRGARTVINTPSLFIVIHTCTIIIYWHTHDFIVANTIHYLRL
jgi:hypothetical protein